jgi:hypothetical protein
MDLAGAEEQVLTGLTVETTVARVPPRPGSGELHRVDLGGIGIGTQQDWPLLSR